MDNPCGGQGLCGMHTCPNYTMDKINALIKEMQQHGITVTGNNPWQIDTHQYSIKLCAFFDAGSGVLTYLVTDKSWIVPCSKIWDTIDPLVCNVARMTMEEISSYATA